MVRKDTSLDDVRRKLKRFLSRNPETSVTRKNFDPPIISIQKPWGDESVEIIFRDGETDTISKVLNNIILPHQLSAIHHTKTKSLEIIWTAYKLSPDMEEVKQRCFDFDYDGTTYKCLFRRSSDALIEISKHTVPTSDDSATTYRNIRSFTMYANLGEKDRAMAGLGEPTSFWIRPVKEVGEEFLRLARHMNFYFTYFDSISPFILIHEKVDTHEKSHRFIDSDFPNKISASRLDENLISFWNAARTSNNKILSFIIYYRIIEYASFHYGREQVRQRLKQEISAPSASSNVDKTVGKILSLVNTDRELHETQRFTALIKDAVRPSILWGIIDMHFDFFCERHEFDGGFIVEPLVDKSTSYEDFAINGVENVSTRFRSVRNVLSHGKDYGLAPV